MARDRRIGLRAAEGRLATFAEQAAAAEGPPAELLPDALAELGTLLEEVRACEEEIKAQADALAWASVSAQRDRSRYRVLFDATPLACLVSDRVGLIGEANQAAARLLNAPIGRLVGKPLAIFVAEADRGRFRRALTRAGDGQGGPHGRFKLRPRQQPAMVVSVGVGEVPGPDGELFWALRPAPPPGAGTVDPADVERLRELTGQLQHALAARLVVEQAKGVLMERKGLDEAGSFEVLRALARSTRRRAADVAADVLAGRLRP